MDINICQECGKIKFLPVRYKCKKAFIYIKQFNFFNKKYAQKVEEGSFLKDTFFKKNYPKDCKYCSNNKREENVCNNCKFFIKEEIRLSCKKCLKSWIYQRNFDMLKPSLVKSCIYNFEQEISYLNKRK